MIIIRKHSWSLGIAILFLLTLTCGCEDKSSGSDAPGTDWEILLGGSDFDYAHSILQTANSAYVFAGSSGSTEIPGHSGGGLDYYVVKLDNSGGVLWESLSGGADDEYALTIIETPDQGFLVVGRSNSTDVPGCTNRGDYDAYVVKFDDQGGVSWQNTYGGNGFDSARSVKEAPGGFYVAGEAGSTDIDCCVNAGMTDYHVMKLDNTGELDWQVLLGGSGYETARSVATTNDGGCVLAGESNSTDIPGCVNKGGGDFYVVKIDNDGGVQWSKTFGGSGRDTARSVLQTSDGGYAVIGHSNSADIDGFENYGEYDSWLIKLDNSGSVEWHRNYGGSDKDFECLLYQFPDGGFVFVGGSKSTDIPGCSNRGDFDVFITRTDSAGKVIWQRMFGGGSYDAGYWIYPTSDGGWVVSGESNSTDIEGSPALGVYDCYIIKLK